LIKIADGAEVKPEQVINTPCLDEEEELDIAKFMSQVPLSPRRAD
jgi:hypothetical protein